MNKVLKRGIKKHLKTLPSARELVKYARLGQAKKGWYTRATKQIKGKYGSDAELFIGILASTSPRQKVENNLRMTETIYSAWLAQGRPNDDNSINELARLSDLPARAGNVKRAFKGIALSGQKVEAFRQNLLGNLDAVTIDTWMVTFAGLYTNVAGSKGGYLAYSHRVRVASRILNWRPAEVQETVWSYAYSQVNKVDINEVAEFEL